MVNKYRPKNLLAAIEKGADFDPVLEKWEPGWNEYLASCKTVDRRARKKKVA
jgi:hypothetical protein